jgi:hypothetical protein
MGWYSGVIAHAPQPRLDVYDLSKSIMKEVSDRYDPSAIGHVKLIYTSEQASLKMSLVSDSVQVDGIKGGRYSDGPGRLVLNARIMAPPAQIRNDLEDVLSKVCASLRLQVLEHRSSTLAPKPEVPDHYLKK